MIFFVEFFPDPMPRAPFQILVFPFRYTAEGIRYALFERREGFWQGIAGGGENDETPEQAARREAFEEGGIAVGSDLVPLDSTASIPVIHFRDHHLWGPDRHVIPEYSFGLRMEEGHIRLCDEHTACRWLPYQEAYDRLRFDSNRTALWELNRRLERIERVKE